MIDLRAYCRRVGYDGDCRPELCTLRDLHRLHPQAIPFENLDPLLGRPVRLDAASLEAKLVRGGRGGYCFEQNLLFAAVLRAIGFRVRKASARVRWNVPSGVVTGRVHALLIVEADGEDYLVDVGFGGNVPTGPLLLRSRTEQATPHEPFRLSEEAGHILVEAKIESAWTSLYVTDLAHTASADFEVGNWFTSTHPNSVFVNGLMASRADADRRYAIRNNRLSVHRVNGGSEKHVLRNARELRDALRDLLRIRLDGLAGLDEALARLAAGAP